MKPVVVGIDGSPGSVNALDWAADVARATERQLVAVNAFIPEQSERWPGTIDRLRAEQTELLADWCRGHLEGVDHQLVATDGDPRDVLPETLGRHDADLLVVASVGRSKRGPGFLAIGSVVEYLAHHLDHPMVVITPNGSTPVNHIVVAVDGSSNSRTAVEWAAELAEAVGATVTAVAVKEPNRPISDATDDTAWREAAEHIVATEWAERLAGLGERFHVVATRQLPVPEAILSTAADERADLVVLGARGVGGVTGMRVGGVALATLHRADLPVALVPPIDSGP